MTMEYLGRSFAVSLHVLHPSVDPAEVTRTLELIPSRSTSAGPPRKPPYDYAWWMHRFDSTNVRELTPFLAQIAVQLSPHREYLNHLRDTGGSIELFCGIRVDFNWDEVVSAVLMGQLYLLGIDLRLDAYPQDARQDRTQSDSASNA